MLSPTVPSSSSMALRFFSADFSSCFMLSPTVPSSSSMALRFFSASSRLFQLFHVITYSAPFFFNGFKVFLSKLSSFHTPFKLCFLNTKFSGELIKFLFTVNSHLDCSSETFVEFFNRYFIAHTCAFNCLYSFQDNVCRFGGKS